MSTAHDGLPEAAREEIESELRFALEHLADLRRDIYSVDSLEIATESVLNAYIYARKDRRNDPPSPAR